MKYIFYIAGETVSKKNNRITTRTGRSIPSNHYRKWHSDALVQILKQDRPVKPINSAVRIIFNFMHNTKQRRDSDNAVTSLLDTLQDALVLKDDSWQVVREMSVNNFYDATSESGVHIIIKDAVDNVEA